MYYSATINPAANAAVGFFVCAEAGVVINDFCSMGVFEDGKLIAGTLYHNYHPESGVIELSSASISKRWLTKATIRAMFWLPFIRLGCQICILRVSERNKTMIGIARKFGFDEVYIPRLRGRDEGEFIFSLTDDAWRAHRVGV
jgi:RimJ/RimL family protein N-acetyltransferase